MKNIFISSTFRDMQAERDMVQERVLPALREEARKYGDNVGVIDLRWGVDTSTLETEEGAAKVLSVCLDEIERSHPYMLIFIGERYGWIPEGTLIEKAVRNRSDKYVTEDFEKSVTALEIEYGALSEKYGELNHCVICFREPVTHLLDEEERVIYEEQNAKGVEKLWVLKEKIRQDLGSDDRLITYSGTWDKSAHKLVDFQVEGQPLEEVLTNCYIEMFHEDWQQYEAMSWQEKEQLAFRALMESKLRSFVGREGLLDEYYHTAVNSRAALVLQGGVGSGKTSIMCKLVERLRQEGKNVFAFFSGAGTMSGTAEGLVKQMVYYLETLLEVPERFAENREEMDGDVQGYNAWLQQFNKLCKQVNEKEKVYFCIDAIDQLYQDEHVENLDFITTESGVQMVISCIDSFVVPEYNLFELQTRMVPGLGTEDAKRVIRGIMASYSRDTFDAVEEEILKKENRRNPLYISLLIQRLNMLDDELQGADDAVEIINRCVDVIKSMPDELDDAVVAIIGKAIEKMEEPDLQQVVNYLAVSRNGLRVQDLQGIFTNMEASVSMLSVSRLMKYLDSFFYIHEDDRIDFTHKVIRRGLLELISNRNEYEWAIGQYLQMLDQEDTLRLREGMYYARVMKNDAFAKELVEYAYDTGKEEVVKKIIEESVADAGAYCSRLIMSTSAMAEEKMLFFFRDIYFDKLDLTQKELKAGTAIACAVLQKSVQACNIRATQKAITELVTVCGKIGSIFEKMGEFDKSDTFYWYAAKNIDKTEKTEQQEYALARAECFYNLGKIHLRRKKFDKARQYLSDLCLLVEQHNEKEFLPLGVAICISYSELLLAMQLKEDAWAQGRKTIEYVKSREALCEDDNEKAIADAYHQMGKLYWELQKTEDALECYLTAMHRREEFNRRKHSLHTVKKLAESYTAISHCYYANKAYNLAENYLKKAIICNEEVYSKNSSISVMRALAQNYELQFEMAEVMGKPTEEKNETVVNLLRSLAEMYWHGRNGVRRDYKEAFNYYLQAAKRNDKEAQFQLGWTYETGKVVEQSDEKAAEWYQRAATQGHPGAQNNLGVLYKNGRGVEQSDEKAVSWYQKAATQGLSKAQENLAELYAIGQGVEQSDEKAVSLYQKAAEQGDVRAQFWLGYLYWNGLCGLECSPEKAVNWYKLAAEQGYAIAQNNLGFAYGSGRGVEQDYQEEIYWYQKAAEQNYAIAQGNLGWIYYNGNKVEKDEEKAVEWFQKAAENGNNSIQYQLGWMHENGKIVELDYEQADYWYQKSAVQGYERAQKALEKMREYGTTGTVSGVDVAMATKEELQNSQYYLQGTLYEEGKEREQNYEKAIEYYKKAANAGNKQAQKRLAELHHMGIGVEKNMTEALFWYEKLAAQGDEEICYKIACIYREGDEVEQNNQLMVEWYRKAASLGHVTSQCDLGWAYLTGTGVKKNNAEAVKWYEMAAAQGHSHAQYSLGLMYEQGDGVEQDVSKAAEYYEMAAEQNSMGALRKLAELYKTGCGVVQNGEKAVALYERAIQNGDKWSKYNLAKMYEEGCGCQKDMQKAVNLYIEAANEGVLEAIYDVGILCDEGKHMQQNMDMAIKYYQIAAEHGHARAQYTLAEVYLNGRGVIQNAREAVTWYQKAAENGDVEAQYKLAVLFLSGQGTKQNTEEALFWYEKAAEQNQVDALFHMSLLYGTGCGVSQNDEMAQQWYEKWMAVSENSHTVEWIRKMANQGIALWQCLLGYMCETGHGVEKTEEQAVLYYGRAAEQGNQIAQNRMSNLKQTKKGFLESLFSGKKNK